MEQESAFNELKHRLTIAPVLAYPDFSPDAGLFVVDTDANPWALAPFYLDCNEMTLTV